MEVSGAITCLTFLNYLGGAPFFPMPKTGYRLIDKFCGEYEKKADNGETRGHGSLLQ